MAWRQSRIAGVLRAVTERAARAREESAVVGTTERLATRAAATVRGSVCYRWLTGEPEPSVVVIDLRETRTVGPFVRVLESVADPAQRAWANSRLASVAAAAGDTLAGSRTGQLLATLLAPPESPDDTDETA